MSALVDRAVNPGLRILPQAMNKLQGERVMVNKKYDISLSPVIKSRESLKETPERGGEPILKARTTESIC
ncbi:MAG: hypothetical protein D3924_07230 [Candidatus Electrothrix sp. AR4]|nr:hypothetical protein [Candidatus Electrothrix sp. AR4]